MRGSSYLTLNIIAVREPRLLTTFHNDLISFNDESRSTLPRTRKKKMNREKPTILIKKKRQSAVATTTHVKHYSALLLTILCAHE